MGILPWCVAAEKPNNTAHSEKGQMLIQDTISDRFIYKIVKFISWVMRKPAVHLKFLMWVWQGPAPEEVVAPVHATPV